MNLIVTFVNLLALLMGAYTIGISFRLAKDYSPFFLSYYLYFLICSVISGFFDWISFNWIIFLSPDFTSHNVDIVYHIFWDLIGFPAAIFASYFLICTLLEMIEVRFNPAARKVFLGIVIVLTLLSFASLSFRLQNIDFPISIYLWILFLYILPLLQLSMLFASFRIARKLKMSQRNYIQKFILILFFGYSIWYFLMLSTGSIGLWRHLIIMVFYITLLLPTLYLKNYLASAQNKVMFNSPSPEKLKSFLDENNFTTREIEVIGLLITGKSNQQIADELFISLQTVKNYVSKIYRKFNLKSRMELVNYLSNSLNSEEE